MRDFSRNYLEILKTDLAGLNLTRILDEEDFYQKQIVDSIAPYEQSTLMQESLKKTNLLVDIGFGGGFPILPLAKTLPELRAVGFEARAKKAKAVMLIAQRLGLQNVKCFHQRFEHVFFDLPTTVTFKAVADITELLPQFRLAAPCEIFFYKGALVQDKEKVPENFKGWQLVKNEKIDVPGTDARYLISYRATEKIIVPRGTKADKELVNLSALV